MDQNQSKALYEIQILEFNAIELNLYLDTHPEDKEALKKYNLTVKELKEAKRDYEDIFGLLTNFGDEKSKYPWQWIQAPWPWEL
jgi:spore coat protein JB